MCVYLALQPSASWEDAALDDWEDASLAVLPSLDLGLEEDLAEKEKKEEEERLAALAEARRQRAAEEEAEALAKEAAREKAKQASPAPASGGGGGKEQKKGMEVIEVDTQNMTKSELEAHDKKLSFRAKRKEREV